MLEIMIITLASNYLKQKISSNNGVSFPAQSTFVLHKLVGDSSDGVHHHERLKMLDHVESR
jgi:hypothetical protein